MTESPCNTAGTRQIHISEFDYPLPDDRIARHPCEPRDECRLIRRLPDGTISHHIFTQLPELLPADALMVWNNTKVINARLQFHKSTGARIEIFCLEPESPRDYNLMFQSRGRCSWNCLVGNLKRWKEGELQMEVEMPDKSKCTLSARLAGEGKAASKIVEFSWTPQHIEFAAVIEAAGRIPIPPYLNRNSEDCDSVDYQTVYSKIEGSVAAPTAGLHFTDRVLGDLDSHGVECAGLTLHVGAGTFRPVKSETIGGHDMHSETFTIDRALLGKIIEAKKNRRPVIAVGTTSVRTLESLPWLGVLAQESGSVAGLHLDQWRAYADEQPDTIGMLESLACCMDNHQRDTLTASTSIMIAPGFNWRIVDAVVTNFHQPQSTLLLLVSSFMMRGGGDAKAWRRLYDEALGEGYRFLSYGDSCLLF